jgi:Tfp pilus assembly protein PilF
MKKIILLAFIFLAACATHDKFRENREFIEAGNIEEGLTRLEQQVKEHPNDVELRNYFLRHRTVAVQSWISIGDNALGAGQFDVAEESYRRALRFEESNARAYQGVQAVDAARRHKAALAEADTALKAGNTAEATARLKQILAENPQQREAKLHAAQAGGAAGEDRAGRARARRRAEEADHAGIPRRAAAPGVRADLEADRPQLHLRQGREPGSEGDGVRARTPRSRT